MISMFQVYVKVVDQMNENEYLWSKNRFLNRQVHMQEMYQQFEETDQVPDVPQVRRERGGGEREVERDRAKNRERKKEIERKSRERLK